MTRTRDLPPYVRRGGQQTVPPPIEGKDAQLRLFGLKCERPEALQELCDIYLNHPWCPWVYHPVGHHVLMSFGHIAKEFCTTPPESEEGWIPEYNVAFWVPVIAGKRTLLGKYIERWPWFPKSLARILSWWPHRLVWFLPYIFVDSGPAMASGRENFGFPKQIGRFLNDAEEEHPDFTKLYTRAMPKFAPDTGWCSHPLIELVSTATDASGEAEKVEAVDSLERLAGHVARRLGTEDAPEPTAKVHRRVPHLINILEHLIKLKINWVFLKQFRDAVESRKACYQAVVEVPNKIKNPRDLKFKLKPHQRVKIHCYESHRLVRDLGLCADPDQFGDHVHVEIDFEASGVFDMELALARPDRIWEAP